MDDEDKPRPRAPTLVGVGPSSVPPVVGALGRPPAPGVSEVTRRMIFEPPSPTAAHGSLRPGSPEEAEIDDEWPDEPPTAEAAQLLPVPPPPLVPTGVSVAETEGVQSRRGAWFALAAIGVVLAAGGSALRHHRATEPSAASSVGSAPAPAPESATTPAPATSTESAPTPAPTPTPEPTPTATTSPFDPLAAKEALDATATSIAHCRRGAVFGSAHAIVTFGNDGTVHHCAVSPPFLGTVAGMCVAAALSKARVPAFAGKPGAIVHHFVVPAQ